MTQQFAATVELIRVSLALLRLFYKGDKQKEKSYKNAQIPTTWLLSCGIQI